ncbi:unnamed protein product [Strongylus vulgaris]|uniref:Reverse transcriptase domain-containing protein n=1 Tax=Strongylus vulgaris TaxID=40348 RepID=A0A3P7K239_STRVU|nr:unnamed protein product [Strongylus vulgaris]
MLAVTAALQPLHKDFAQLDFARDSAAWFTIRRLQGLSKIAYNTADSCPDFVNYEKAFDSIETNAIVSALVGHWVDLSYVRTADCYKSCFMTYSI